MRSQLTVTTGPGVRPAGRRDVRRGSRRRGSRGRAGRRPAHELGALPGALALDRAPLGVLLVVAEGTRLAATLVGAGLALLRLRHVAERLVLRPAAPPPVGRRGARGHRGVLVIAGGALVAIRAVAPIRRRPGPSG
ncbi:MAG TPA: hypothetical protein VHF25_13135 [Nitriliruptorales bacterium]|nr:hypothetical protein [Nitriliruptorales bacterium]